MEKTSVSVSSYIRQKNRRQLLLFPSPFQGHISPMIQLANILYSKGFSIIIIHTHFNTPIPSKYPQFTFHSISEGLLEIETSTQDILAINRILNLKCAEPFRLCLAKLLSDSLEEDPIACLITDHLWQFSGAIAQDLKLPVINLRVSSASFCLAFAALPFLQDKYRSSGIQDSQLEVPVQELPPLKVKDFPDYKTQDRESLHQFIEGVVKQTKTSSGLIVNSCDELEKDSLTKLGQEFNIPIFPIGPFCKYFTASSSSLLTQDQSCISWLDNQASNSVLYISFGSLATITETEFLEIAWGLANSNQPFLWVVRPGLVQGRTECLQQLPNRFQERIDGVGLIVKWAPQQEVLAHPATGGFWTHNGWNSTMESICEGVPMICTPLLLDQMVNTRYVIDVWGIGLDLERQLLKREKIVRVVRKLILEEEGKELRDRIIRLKNKVDLCLSQDGSAYRSLENLVNILSI